MNQLLAGIPWKADSGSTTLYTYIILTVIVGFAIVFGFTKASPRGRKVITGSFVFVSGLIYVLYWLWPQAQDRKPQDLPRNFVEQGAFFLQDTIGAVGDVSNILTAILLLMGVFSLARFHVIKLAKQQKDWGFSLVLLVCMATIAAFGYVSWHSTLSLDPKQAAELAKPENWTMSIRGRDFLFDGLLQAMDAAMFSIIAFYILSAAYRAFRVRSIEATILLASAFVVMLSLLGLADLAWGSGVDALTRGSDSSFFNNFRLSEIAGFIQRSFQVPGIRAIDFGIGVGQLAMGLRLWLGLERAGNS